ncbi:MAG: outer membrane lipoprotein carrier protein LolA [Spirochaetes bacterium]|nr:outer membrane lipoprotein carrier protein LolA [Spirochaetota bacterium]
MKRIVTLLFVIFSVITSAALYADDWDEIKNVAKDIKSVKADFIQEKHLKILNKPLISKGRFFFTAPTSLRWEYITPVKSILLMHNGRVKSYISGEKGFVEDSRSKAQAMGIVMQEITSWLNGRFHDDPNFKADLYTGRYDKIVLTPKDKSFLSIIQSIELEISRKQGIIKSVKITENKDSYTILKFSGINHNQQIDDKYYRDAE